MIPKKKEKDVDASVGKQPKMDQLQADHELFMQAFEKPTQIYRYLRTRNMISPVFLNRNLSYMRHRMSRSHKSRNTFKIDSMLATKLAKLRQDKVANGLSFMGEYLTLLFLGFFDKQLPQLQQQEEFKDDATKAKAVQVETVLLKISHNKRKELSSTLMQIAVGKSEVAVNPPEEKVASATTENIINDKVPAISIATEAFNSVGVNHVAGPQLSFLLLFRVHMPTTSSASNGYCSLQQVTSNGDSYESNGAGSDDEPSAKRHKLTNGAQQTTTKLYGTELIIFDKYGRCLLKEGDYELTVQEILPHQQHQLQKYNSPKKNSTWETIQSISSVVERGMLTGAGGTEIVELRNGMLEEQSPLVLFAKNPLLKFRLQWTKEALPGLVDRPAPITISLNNNECNSDKENHKPDAVTSPGFKKNLNNNSILAPVATSVQLPAPPLSASNSSPGTTSSMAPNGTSVAIQNKPRFAGAGEEEPRIDHIIYQFVYSNNSRQQTETKLLDFHCPWCSLNCGSLYPLLKHLKLCHARFCFTYVPIAPNGARIDVSINELYDGSYNGSPHDQLLLGSSVNSYSRRGPVRRTVVTNLLVCRPRRQKHSLSEFIECDENEFDSQRPYITGHNRMYHHTMTCLPVHPKELDIDSEGESDPLWLQQKTMQMIDEFTDVNEGEKELMKMWNLHVMKFGYVGDCQIPIALDMFIDCRGRELLAKNLYRNFILHVCSMFDFGLVSPEVMQRTVRKLQKLLFESPDLQKRISTARKEQMEYWNRVTVHKQAQPKTEKQGADKAGAGAGTATTGIAGAGGGVSKSNSSGSSGGGGPDKKVKPTITPAKNTAVNSGSLTSIGSHDRNAISPPRRRSASAALHSSNASSLPNAVASQNNNITHNSSQPSSSASHPKRTSAGSSGSGGNSKLSSTITTRRKSLSVGTHQQLHQQRKRSLN